jgi:hypothetical protein
LKDEPYDLRRDGVSQSLLGSWVHCKQAVRYALDGWRSEETKDSLAYGGFVHSVLVRYHRAIMDGGVTAKTSDALLLRLFDGCAKLWRAKHSDEMRPEQMELLIAKARGLWVPYCRQWPSDTDSKMWVSVEATFDVLWNGVRLRGRKDGVRLRGKKRKSRWVWETKTAGQIRPEALELTLVFDFQNLFYVLAEQIGSGQPVAGVLRNIVRRPQHKQKAGESLAAFSDRIREEAEANPDHFFQRYEAPYSKKRVAQFESGLDAKLKDFEAWLKGAAPHYPDEASCVGRYNCDWLPACASGTMVGYRRDGRLFEELED